MAKSLPGNSADKPEQTEDEEMEDIEPPVAAEETVGTRAHVCGRLGRVKWLLWHGNVGPALEEIEMNPVLLTPSGAVAVDALIRKE